jgi:hypothetical protein
MKFRLLGMLALLPLLAACGDDSSGGSPSDTPAGLLVAGDFDIDNFGSEASNLMFALQQAGFPLDTTSETDSTSIAALLAGKEIVFFPEVEPNFDAGTQAILVDFVDAGGTIVLVGGYQHIDWLNSANGWALVEGDGWSNRHPMPRQAAADGTPFEDGPATIPANDGGANLTVASLPGGALKIYNGPDGDTNASVAILPVGSGRFVYFGWDWYDGLPRGIQDGGWRKLLRQTADF